MLLQTSDILQVEPAHIDDATGLHCHGVGSKVGKEDVTVDVGNDEVEMPRKGLQGRGIAMDDIDAVAAVTGFNFNFCLIYFATTILGSHNLELLNILGGLIILLL